MGAIFTVISVLSIMILIFVSPETALSSMLSGAEGAIRLAITLVAIYAVWLSLLKLIEQTGLSAKIARILRPLMVRLFPGESEKAYEAITLNMSANMLGLGGAATPAGIRAIEEMGCKTAEKATHNMCMFVVINCTSIQLLPATVIAMRVQAGSANASDIIIPALIATTISTLFGVFLCVLMRKFAKKQQKFKPVFAKVKK